MGRGETNAVRFAIIGDAEPKPDPVFEWLPAVVETINRQHASAPIHFVGGIGDIAHEGTREQYEAASEHLARLEPVFHPIMGNEELTEGADRFLRYAREWTDEPDAVPDVQYTKEYGGYRFVFASPLVDGRAFTADQLDWFVDQLERARDRPVIGFIHTAPVDVLPVGRSMSDRRFDRVLAHPSWGLCFHGHSHLAITEHPFVGRDDWGRAHVHVPGIERTKIGSDHTPYFAIVEIDVDGTTRLRWYDVSRDRFATELERTIEIPSPPTDDRGR